MTIIEKLILVAVAACLVSVAVGQVYHAGERAGRVAMAREYESQISARVNEGIAGARRVMAIREESEYRRGFEACQEQF